MQLPGRAGQGAWVWNEQLELETSNTLSSRPSLLAWLWWSWAAPRVWPVHILGVEVLTSISPTGCSGSAWWGTPCWCCAGGKQLKPHPSCPQGERCCLPWPLACGSAQSEPWAHVSAAESALALWSAEQTRTKHHVLRGAAAFGALFCTESAVMDLLEQA